MLRVDQLVQDLKLQPHPEGGFFREIYRSSDQIRRDAADLGFPGDRNCSTGIYFLLPGWTFSAFHRIRSDELWHFYEGNPVVISMITETGEEQELKLGPPESGGEYQVVVPKNRWFAARCIDPDGFALVGCTVAPGFDFADFELADRETLIAEFPAHKQRIIDFTRQT